MANGSPIDQAYPSPEGAPAPKKTRKRRAQDPIGTTPWGDPSTPEAQSHQQLITAVSEAAAPVQEFIQSLIGAIVDGLGTAVTELGNLAQDLQLTIGEGLTPAVMALTQMKQDLRNEIKGQILQSAEYVSAGTGQPVYYQKDGSLNVVTSAPHPSIPINPDHHIPGRTIPPPAPLGPPAPARPGHPNYPVTVPGSPGVGAPPAPPLPPAGAPGHPGPIVPTSVPGAPGFPGFPQPGRNPIGPRRWDGSAAAGSAASTPGASAPGGVTGSRGMGGGGGGGYYWSHRMGGPYIGTGACNGVITDGSDPPEGSSYVVSEDGSVVWSFPNCSYYDHDPNGPGTPTGPTPTPTQTPINPYDPTNSLPGTPGMPGPAPTTPTTPSTPPTGPPIAPDVPYPPAPPSTPQTPTTPPIAPDVPYPPAPPIPEPPTAPCPPGFDWAWTGYQYECLPYNYGPPPPTPEPQPTPLPEPVPEPQPGPTGGGGSPPSKPPACSGKKDDPCWRAANAMDERDIPFHVTAGFARALADGKAALATKDDFGEVTVNAGPALIDNGGGPQICDPVYQMSIITGDIELTDLIPSFGDLNGWVKKAVEGKSLTDKVVNYTLYAPFVAFWTGLFTMISKLSKAIWSQFMGMNQTLGGEIQQRTLLKIMNTITFGGLERVVRIFDTAGNFNYPTDVPSPEAASAAWLAREIDECTFETYVRAGNFKYPNYKQVVRAGKLHFTALELKTLDKRHGLVRMALPDRLRELGSLHTEDMQELETLFAQLPGPADITRFMMRDTDNAEIVGRFRLDDGFTDNFVGQLKEWANQQGVSEDIMRRFWRAHYDIPSPTQLYLMLHRFRHGGDPTPGGDIESDVRLALRQQDILPYWHDRLIGIAYHPLNRTDLNRAYEKGWIDDDRYLKGMYDNGYNDDDAKTLLRFAGRERALAIRHADFTTAYSHGYIDPDTLRQWAESEGYQGEVLSEIQEVADFMLRVRTWEDQTKAISHQFRACRITEDEAREDASALGIPESVIDRALGISELNTTCGTRREMVGSLCQALDAGFISPQEYVDRMRKLKYDQFAIDNYLGLCQNKIAARKAKEAARAQKEAEREIEKEIKAEEKAQRQAEARANRLAKALATQERRRVQRNDKLERVGNKLGQSLSDMDGPDAEYVDMLWRGLQDIKGLSQDDAANVLVVTSGSAKGMTRVEYRDWVYDVAPLALTEPWQLFPSVPVVTNGHS